MLLLPPNNIAYSSGDGMDIDNITRLMAESINNRFTAADALRQGYNYRWANQTDQTNQTGMRFGDTGFREDNRLTYQYNGSAWRAVIGQRIIPSSVSGTGVTLDSLTGVVTFTGSASVGVPMSFDIRGAFPSDFRNFRVVIEMISSAADTGGQIILLNGTTADTATQYNAITGYDVGTTRTIGAGNGQIYWPALGIATRTALMDMRLYGITDATVASMYRNDAIGFSTANIAQQHMSGRYLTAKAHDGFRYLATQQISGRLYVEGTD